MRQALADFASLWDLMTPANRQRLVGALVDRVEVNEPAGKITVGLATDQEAA